MARQKTNSQDASIGRPFDGTVQRTETGAEANDLDNTLRIYSALWKVK